LIHKDEAVLDLFRGPGQCELCGARCKRREPHHWRARGAGGGARLDIRENLIALGSAFDCACHVRAEAGLINRQVLLFVIALREHSTPKRIEARIFKLLRTPKR